MSAVRIVLGGHEHRGRDFFLLFTVDLGHGEEAASVLVGSGGGVLFPHPLCTSGASFGSALDAALIERAEQTIALFDAADAWRAMRDAS